MTFLTPSDDATVPVIAAAATGSTSIIASAPGEACRGAAAKAIEIAFGKEAADAPAEYSRAHELGEFGTTIADLEATNARFQTAEWQESLDRASGALFSRGLSNVGTLATNVEPLANQKGLLAQPPPDRPPKPKTKRGTP